MVRLSRIDGMLDIVSLQRLRAAGLAYVFVELWRLWCFKRLLRRLNVRRYAHRGGQGLLKFAHSVLMSKEAPLAFDRSLFARYIAEGGTLSVGYGGGSLDWKRIYAWWAWGIGRPFDPQRDPKLHLELLEVVAESCRGLEISLPPSGAEVPTDALPPFGFGNCELRPFFKPLPLRAPMRCVQLLTRTILQALGFRRVTEMTPEGEIVCWTDLRENWPVQGRRPIVFLHGLGAGIFTYLPLFVGKATSSWRAGGCLLLEYPTVTSAWADLETMPTAVHYADALGRLLRTRFQIKDFEFDVVCHSAGSFFAALLCNEGSPCCPKRTVLIDPVCFLEGVEVCSRFPFRTQAECNDFADATVLFPGFLPLAVRRLLAVAFRQLVCRDIFVQYSVLRWTGTDAGSTVWYNTQAQALVCLSMDDHFVPADRVARHCAAHFPQADVFEMPSADHGSFVIDGALRRELMSRMEAFLSAADC